MNSFPRNVARNGGILVLLGDFIDLIDVDNTLLGPRDIPAGILQQFQDDVFDVLSHIAGFRQGGSIHNRERHFQLPGERLRQQSLASARGPNEQNVRFGEFYVAASS